MNRVLLVGVSRVLLGVVACAAVTVVEAAESLDSRSSPAHQQIMRAGTQSSFFGPAANFTGRVRVDPLFPSDADIPAAGAYVTFEPGARSAWHIHPAGQRLVVISGVGLTQQWGKPVQEVRAGDVVVCPAGIKHWHGAAPTTAMTHLAVSGLKDGKSVEWKEKVSDDQYNAR